MNKSELRKVVPGTVLALVRRGYTSDPMMVLDTRGLWTWQRSGSDKVWYVSTQNRYTVGSHTWTSRQGDHGYLILKVARSHRSTQTEEELTARMVELYHEFKETAGNPGAVNALYRKTLDTEGIYLDVENNRYFAGELSAVRAEKASAQAAQQEEQRKECDRAAAESATRNEIAELIAAKLEKPVNGAADNGWGHARISFQLDDLAAYFGVKAPKDRL